MPLDYGTTRRMRDAVESMHAHAVGDKVGLVMRWNRRDDMIWTIYSEFMDRPDPKNISPSMRRQFVRMNGDAAEEMETFAPSTTPTSLIGCHAEEIMIVNWTYFELDAVSTILTRALGVAEPAPWASVPLRTEKFVLREVDLVLSKSPCHGPGGSQPLRLDTQTYGTGCAMKLYRFCSLPRFEQVRWRIFYAALPPEKHQSRLEPRQEPVGVQKKVLKQWRVGEQQRLSAIQKNLTGLGKMVPPLDRRPDARSQFGRTVGLALRGIGMLNSLRNVSCEPL